MTDRPPRQGPDDERDLDEAVRRHRVRRDEARRHGERSIRRNLAVLGVMGWLIVLPTLAGTFAGRWLDRAFEAKLFWTGSLMFVGLVIGCYLAWQWANRA